MRKFSTHNRATGKRLFWQISRIIGLPGTHNRATFHRRNPCSSKRPAPLLYPLPVNLKKRPVCGGLGAVENPTRRRGEARKSKRPTRGKMGRARGQQRALSKRKGWRGRKPGKGKGGDRARVALAIRRPVGNDWATRYPVGSCLVRWPGSTGLSPGFSPGSVDRSNRRLPPLPAENMGTRLAESPT